jgi:ribonuclease BN (tRNA processing enzyme)
VADLAHGSLTTGVIVGMRLTVLGGSAAGPNPGQGCSAYLIESRDTQIVVDLGPGTLPTLRLQTDFRLLSGVVLSHLHLDHFLDVLALRFALSYNPVPPPCRLPLWLPPGGCEFLARLASVLAEPGTAADYFAPFEIHEYDPESVLPIGDLTIQFQPTVHYVPCWAMRVSNGRDGDLFYTADTGPAADFSAVSSGTRIFVAEATEESEPDQPFASRGHLQPFQAGEFARIAGAEILVLTHMWAEHDPFAAVAEAERSFGGPVMLATPGMSISWQEGTLD